MGEVTFGSYGTFLKLVDTPTNLREAELTRLFFCTRVSSVATQPAATRAAHKHRAQTQRSGAPREDVQWSSVTAKNTGGLCN